MRVLLIPVLAEVYSDLVVSHDFQERALKARHARFWTAIEESAVAGDYVDAVQGLAVCVAELPSWGDDSAKVLLEQSLAHLLRAAQQVQQQGGVATEVAAAALERGPTEQQAAPKGFFQRIYQNFVAEDVGRAPGVDASLRAQVAARQRGVADILKGSARMDVLTDTRLASKLAFDALKYDIYAKTKVPKTPQAAKDIADKIVELHHLVRRAFLGVITTSANQLAQDVTGSLSTPAPVMDEVMEGEDGNHLRLGPDIRV